jgi:hypothetical protein
MFKFKLPDALNPKLFMAKKQTELRKQHDEWKAETRKGPQEGEREKLDYAEMAVSPDEVKARMAEQLRHAEMDVDGQLDVAPMRVVTKEEQRQREIRAARLRNEYNQKRGTK